MRATKAIAALLALLGSASVHAAPAGCADEAALAENVAALMAGKTPGKRKWGSLTPMMCIARSESLTDEQKAAAARVLAANGEDFNELSANGDTALHYAAQSGAPELARFLIDAGADPDAINLQGNSPVQLAMQSGNAELVEVFGAHGRYIDNRNNTGRTSLYEAASRGDLDLVKQLLALGADAGASDRSALTGAALAGQEAVVRYFIDEANLSVDMRSSDGETPLMAAAAANELAMARLLIEQFGATADLASPNGSTALSLAATAGHVDMMRYLLSHGATDAASQPSATAVAALSRQPAALALLLDHGAEVGSGTPEQPGVLYWAGVGGSDEILRALVERGAAFPQLPPDTGPLPRAVLSRHYAQGLLAREQFAEALPYLSETTASYDEASATLEARAAEAAKAANRAAFRHTMFLAFASAFGQFAAAYQQSQNNQAMAQTMALGYASQSGAGVDGYFKAYSDIMAGLDAPTTLPPAQGSFFGGSGYKAESLRAAADAMTRAAAQYRGESAAAGAMLECAQAAAAPGASSPAGRCLGSN